MAQKYFGNQFLVFKILL